MADFAEILTHHDQKIEADLDAKYIQQEWKFAKEKHESKMMPKDVPPVDPEIRKEQVQNRTHVEKMLLKIKKKKRK